MYFVFSPMATLLQAQDSSRSSAYYKHIVLQEHVPLPWPVRTIHFSNELWLVLSYSRNATVGSRASFTGRVSQPIEAAPPPQCESNKRNDLAMVAAASPTYLSCSPFISEGLIPSDPLQSYYAVQWHRGQNQNGKKDKRMPLIRQTLTPRLQKKLKFKDRS